MLATTLTDSRLSLTPPSRFDEKEIFSICQDSDIQRWTTLPSPYSRDDASHFIEQSEKNWRDDRACTWVIRSVCSDDCEPGPILGCISLTHDGIVGDVGYWTRAENRNQGIITDALGLVIDYAFQQLQLQSLTWRAEVNNGELNWASYKPVWKHGFTYAGIVRGGCTNKGKAVDCMVASLRADDSREIKEAWRGPDDTHPAFPNPRDPEALVRQFHETYGLPIMTDTPSADRERIHMRLGLIAEEFAELIGAAYGPQARATLEEAWKRAQEQDEHLRDTVEVADALGDLVYVTYGAALEFAIPMEALLAEIQASNLSKLGADGKPIYREDGKVLKGPNFFPPNVKKVLGL